MEYQRRRRARPTAAQRALFRTGWFVVGLLTKTLLVHMIRTEKVPFLQSTASPVVLVTAALAMLAGVALPFTPLAAAIHLQPLPAGFFVFLPAVLLGYCLLTQLAKTIYRRRFGARQ